MNANMGKFLIAGLLLTTACASSSELIASDPDRYDVTCRRKLGNCYEEARSVCPNGFTVVDGDTRNGAVVNAIGNSAFVTPTYNGELIVECK